MSTAAELKAVYGDPLTYFVVESTFAWDAAGHQWTRSITKVKTTDDVVHDVEWMDVGHTDAENRFVHDSWVDDQGDHYEVGPFA